jgi:acyl-CoA synthetase (AMP-forming)/AMP-acid ligase II
MVIKLNRGVLIEPLESLVKNNPNKTVFISKSRSLTASELFRSSQSVAVNLLKNGFRENDVVAMVVAPGFEFLEIFYALLLLRAKIAIIDPEMGRENYTAKMKQLSPSWMFVDSRLLFLEDWPMLKKLIVKFRNSIPEIHLSLSARVIKVGPAIPTKKPALQFGHLKKTYDDEVLWVNNTEPFDNVIVYTSGTLDVPKGVLHSDLSLSTTIQLLKEIINGDLNDVVGTYLPHFMLLGIASGLNVKIMPVRMNAKRKLAWLTENQINIMFGPPSEMLPLILHCEVNQCLFPQSIKHLMLGSAPVHQGFLKRLISVLPNHTKITCTYGMTEHLLVAIADGREKAEYLADGDLLGVIIDGVDVKIEPDGEIWVKSKQIYTRYLHLESRNEWHETGDLGFIDDNKNLILKGRKKEMIIRGDFNIYPALYEGTIKKIPGVNEAAMVGIYDENIHDEKVYLAIETLDENVNGLYELLKSGRFSIDRQALPDVVFKMDIPRKGRQDKIDRTQIISYIKDNGL